MKNKLIIIIVLIMLPILVLAYPVGDVNGDNNVNSTDCIMVRKHILKQTTLKGDIFNRADVTHDGKITSIDYIGIRKIAIANSKKANNEPTNVPIPTLTPTVAPTIKPTPMPTSKPTAKPTANPTATPKPKVVTKITLNKSSIVLEVGKSETLTTSITPTDAVDKTLKWSSSNSKVATVTNGKVTAVSGGTSTITVTSSNGISATCIVDVIKSHNIENTAVDKYLASEVQDKVNEKSFEKIQEYLISFLGNYGCKSSGLSGKTKRCDIPNAYVSSISGNIKLYTYDTTKKTKTFVTTTNNDLINFYLIPKTTYYLESASNPKLHEYVSITGKVRMLKINGVTNARDIGGWSADGGRIKYGKIVRSAKTEGASPYTEFKYILGDKIKNVDFRRDDELVDAKPKWVSGINYQRNIPLYVPNDKDSKTRKAIETIMTYITKGYNVFFNCKGGKDRTGTAAYILEGILGVKKSNRVIDYELTNFSSSITWNRKYSKFMSLCSDIKAYDTSNDEMSFVKWYISFSKTTDSKKKDIELINDFRKAMIDGTPRKYKLSSGKLTLE